MYHPTSRIPKIPIPQNRPFSLFRILHAIKAEIRLPIGAISGFFPAAQQSPIAKQAKNLGDPKTIVLLFPELVPKSPPERPNGARIGLFHSQPTPTLKASFPNQILKMGIIKTGLFPFSAYSMP
jgi:hypothetical protein